MTPSPLSPNRLARMIAWLKLWLRAFAPLLLPLLAVDAARVDWLTRKAAKRVADLILLRAYEQSVVARRCAWAGESLSAVRRAQRGSRLRRRIAARDPVSRFFAALALMRDFESETVRAAARLRRGLTRRRPIRPARERRVEAVLALWPAAANADTS